jgi:hypothetical protein
VSHCDDEEDARVNATMTHMPTSNGFATAYRVVS